MFFKNNLALNRVTPSQVKTVHKYSRTLNWLFQPTTNQITPLAFTLENQNYSLPASTLETHWITRISRKIQLRFHVLFIKPAKFEKLQGFSKLCIKKNESNTPDLPDDAARKKQVCKT